MAINLFWATCFQTDALIMQHTHTNTYTRVYRGDWGEGDRARRVEGQTAAEDGAFKKRKSGRRQKINHSKKRVRKARDEAATREREREGEREDTDNCWRC